MARPSLGASAALTPLVFEGARFLQFAYLILYALLARAISRARLHPMAAGVLCLLAYLNLDVSPFSPRVGLLAIGAISVLWVVRGVWLPWFVDEQGVDVLPASVQVACGR